MPDLLPVAAAVARVCSAALEGRAPEREPETVPVDAALGRILARDLAAIVDAPPFDNSAMDGFAVSPGPAGRRLRIVGESRAGRPAARGPGDGEAIRISTGAAMPPGATAVIRVEDTREHDGEVELTEQVVAGQEVRPAGDDVARGQAVLSAGTELGAAELALAVAAGAAEVACSRRPTVAVLCTGDELRPPGASLAPGEIPNSNLVGLAAAARRAGAEVVVAQTVEDTRAATEEAIAGALERCGLVVVSGGVSVGPHDHVKPALAALGVEQDFWGVALRPGKPTWFGRRGESLVLGLPGNPVSAMVTFRLFARPLLRALQGTEPEPEPWRAVLEIPVPRGRREQAVRVRLRSAPDGTLLARPTGAQGSHRLSSLAGADGLALVPAGDGEALPGEPLVVLPWD
jgi:molybdopterin molybdotransferase